MSHFKEFTKAASLFLVLLSCCSGVFDEFIPPIFDLSSNFNCTDKAVKKCQTCPTGTFANATIHEECNCCYTHNRSGQCVGNTTCDPCPPGSYQNKTGQSSCKRCGPGTFCSENGCAVCSACPKGHEAKHKGSLNCTECERGNFKPETSSELCRKCDAGSYANMTGQTKCICCPSGFYCPAGAVEPKPCNSFQVCPAGSGEPGVCEPPWHYKNGDECSLSLALIIIIAIIIIPIALAVIIVIIYKLYKYCQRRRRRELLGGEREPLLTPAGSRPSSRIQEPVYTGL